MSFKGLDIEEMFTDAANAAEDSGEKDPELYGKTNDSKVDKSESSKDLNGDKSQDVKDTKDSKVTETPDSKTSAEVNDSKPSKLDDNKLNESKTVTTEEATGNVESKRDPLLKQSPRENLMSGKGVDVKSIDKIIEMKKILDNYNPTELEFVKGYFQEEEGTSAEIIHLALTVEQRGLDALNKIVTARKHTAAERAFYLMDLDNNSIEAIHEQIDLLTGELGESEGVNEINKIKICRKLENVISTMSGDVFTYINKLQDFTNAALTE